MTILYLITNSMPTCPAFGIVIISQLNSGPDILRSVSEALWIVPGTLEDD